MHVSLSSIHAKSKTDPAYAAAVLAAGQVSGPWLLIDDKSLREIVAQHAPHRLPELDAPACAPAPPAEPSLPPLSQQAATFARALARNATQALSGAPVLVPPDVEASRLAQCHACVGPEGHFRPSDNRCALCSCYLRGKVLAKTRLAAESCPATPPKWGAWKPNLSPIQES